MNNKIHLLTNLISLIVIVASCLTSLNQPVIAQSIGLDLFYTVDVNNIGDTIHVTLNIENLFQPSVNIGFSGVESDIHQFISNLKVESPEIESKIVYSSENIWTITLQKSVTSIIISYDIAKIIPFGGVLPVSPKDYMSKVLITNHGGILSADHFFLIPLNANLKSISGMFKLPSNWQLVTPFIDHGNYFEVPQVTTNLASDFLQRPQIYFGKMKFYSEIKEKNTTIKFGVLNADKAWGTNYFLPTQKDVDFYTQRTAEAVKKFTEIFGEESYPVFAQISDFSADSDENNKYSGGCPQAGLQYWPPARFDELIGHLQYSWLAPNTGCDAPVITGDLIAKGVGESYLAPKIAYELTGDKEYLGKIYSYYLVYERSYNTQYMSLHEINDSYYKGSVIGLYLDHLIQKETNYSKSIYDVFGYLYKENKNKGLVTDDKTALLSAVNVVTGIDNSEIFNKYIYGNDKIPVQDFIQPYKDSFYSFIKILESDNWMNRKYNGYVIPFFIDIELAIPLSSHIPAGLLINDYYQQFRDEILKTYKVNDLSKEDVENTLNKFTGGKSSGFFERWKDSFGELSLEEMKRWLKSNSSNTNNNSFNAAALNDSAIILDGDPVEWPAVSPIEIDSRDPSPCDFKSLFVFSDKQYLYIRIDPYETLPAEIPLLMNIDFAENGATEYTWRAFTYVDDRHNINLVPLVNSNPDFDQIKNFRGFEIGKIIEVVIPLEVLGFPQKMTLHVYATDGNDPQKLLDAFDPVEYDTKPSAIPVSDSPKTITPSPLPSKTQVVDQVTKPSILSKPFLIVSIIVFAIIISILIISLYIRTKQK